MAAASLTFTDLSRKIAKRDLAPVYILHGEEGFYTDKLVEAFEQLIPEQDRDFNLYTLYAPEVTTDTIYEVCRRYPMMSDRQVVIVRECQAVKANEINKIHKYVSAPSPATVLVLVFRGDAAKGRELLAATRKNGVIFESKKLKEGSVSSALSSIIKQHGLNIEPKGLQMLTDYVGTDLSRLYNEVDKLVVALGPGAMITPEAIERNIGISKDYNNFELVDAISARDAKRCFKIIDYFKANPKKNPWVMTHATLFAHFSDLLIYHFTRDKRPESLAAAMGLKSTWALPRYEKSARNYNARQCIEIISAIRQADVQSKGVGSRQDPSDLLHDLVFKILTARGVVPS